MSKVSAGERFNGIVAKRLSKRPANRLESLESCSSRHDSRCAKSIEIFVGAVLSVQQDGGLSPAAYPTVKAAWIDSDRACLCLVKSLDGRRTHDGSIQEKRLPKSMTQAGQIPTL